MAKAGATLIDLYMTPQKPMGALMVAPSTIYFRVYGQSLYYKPGHIDHMEKANVCIFF